MSNSISELIAHKRVVVCCGAGGVGKTTVAASIALAAARAGQRVVVVTIDPSKRLAESLGISPNQAAPVELDPERWEISGSGSLSAWLLDPKRVADHVVSTWSDDEGAAQRLLKNRIYAAASNMISGMQEYTAVEALHGFVIDGRYDLVVLDTPPSRNALRFLDSPTRIHAVLNPRVFKLFLPSSGGPLQRGARRIINGVLDIGLGKQQRTEFQEFLMLFQGILGHLKHNQDEVQEFFRGPDVSFLLVTSPAQEAMHEAFYFEEKTRELKLDLGGYILNRSMAAAQDYRMPSDVELPADASPELRSALKKLQPLAEQEAALVRDHVGLAHRLQDRIGSDKIVRVLPQLPGDAGDAEALVHLSRLLVSDGSTPPPRPSEAVLGGRPLSIPPQGGLPPSESWFPPKPE